MNIVDQQFLEPGHVFTRKDGSSSRILFVTNQSLPVAARKKFPPQVVYADENDNILSRDIPGFLESREFYNVDPELETKLRNLLVAEGATLPEDKLDLDDDSLLVVDSVDELDSMLSTTDSDDAGEEEPEDEPAIIGAAVAADFPDEVEEEASTPVTFVAVNAGLPTALTAEQLAGATASYQQQQNHATGNIEHVLFVRVGDGITKESLDRSFNPLYQDESTLYAPQIRMEGKTITFDWDILVGIYPAVFFDSEMYRVILATDPTQSTAADPVTAQPAEIDPPGVQEGIAELGTVAEAAPANTAPTPVPVQTAQATAVQVGVAATQAA
jgi:hypothetical protein